jgi:hypothetical protein
MSEAERARKAPFPIVDQLILTEDKAYILGV